ncbi:hypothetical protein [Arthrobacter antibioticus]|uniref:hypothetical protein n=1 Tax=Arthrobacter sp. H35-MC1 TaxID=3046203 RepID=UPI0024BAE3C3|nr:hypothetical protein [Arthrobacter sp. H35-MC1]MDJ0318708.1 hypothetical protein [Arthrobacter sp. H35-MC1]
MFAKKTMILSGSAVLAFGALIAITGGVANAGDISDSESAMSWSVDKADAKYDLSILNSMSVSKQQSPVGLPLASLGGDGIQPETVRLVATDENSETYIGLNNSNLLCMIVYVPGSDWTAGSTCTTPDLFDEGGIGLRVENPKVSHETYLVPDAAAKRTDSFAKSFGFKSPNPNILVMNNDLSSEARAKLVKKSSNFPITLIDSATSYEK